MNGIVTNVKNPKTKAKLKETLDDEELTEKEIIFNIADIM